MKRLKRIQRKLNIMWNLLWADTYLAVLGEHDEVNVYLAGGDADLEQFTKMAQITITNAKHGD